MGGSDLCLLGSFLIVKESCLLQPFSLPPPPVQNLVLFWTYVCLFFLFYHSKFQEYKELTS